MPFEQGNKHSKGRKKGSVNKDSETKVFLKKIVADNRTKIQSELNKLEGKQYVDVMLSLMEYVQPKLSRVEMEADIQQEDLQPFKIEFIDLRSVE